ncbi:hypothetical protein EYF80_064036 [Liparis tanakae]|uniref:Uncharacterized protein n=1 Tax=Liparis tanakae TaxID=230148 RepID=A0A4Z2EC01_9TELE|nr:hypothetical protein EYF80_064036 [Liparis tanakae]
MFPTSSQRRLKEEGSSPWSQTTLRMDGPFMRPTGAMPRDRFFFGCTPKERGQDPRASAHLRFSVHQMCSVTRLQ